MVRLKRRIVLATLGAFSLLGALYVGLTLLVVREIEPAPATIATELLKSALGLVVAFALKLPDRWLAVAQMESDSKRLLEEARVTLRNEVPTLRVLHATWTAMPNAGWESLEHGRELRAKIPQVQRALRALMTAYDAASRLPPAFLSMSTKLRIDMNAAIALLESWAGGAMDATINQYADPLGDIIVQIEQHAMGTEDKR